MLLPRLPVFVALALILAGCSHREPIAVQPEPAPVVALAPPPPPPVSPINRGLSQAATLWHFRVALNVAALACRGPAEATIVAGYNAMLRDRSVAMKVANSALTQEFRARGGNWQDAYDDAMTRLYNFFSQAQARDAFCEAAGQTLATLPAVAPEAIGTFAEAQLKLLDAPFALAAAPRQMMAMAAIPATPSYARPATAPYARPVTPAGAMPAMAVRAAPAPAMATRAPVLKVDTRALAE
jgi:hypothetical protein